MRAEDLGSTELRIAISLALMVTALAWLAVVEWLDRRRKRSRNKHRIQDWLKRGR